MTKPGFKAVCDEVAAYMECAPEVVADHLIKTGDGYSFTGDRYFTIKPEWCDKPEETRLVYKYLYTDSTGHIHASCVNSDLSIVPIERFEKRMITFLNTKPS